MILLDADVIILELRYLNDARFVVNRQVLHQVRAHGAVGITQQALLEVIGILSFNTSSGQISRIPHLLTTSYGLLVVPELQTHPVYAGCTVADLVAKMTSQMAIGDAVQAVQIANFAPNASVLLTWNAKHFVEKVNIPVLTPQEWLNRQAPPPP